MDTITNIPASPSRPDEAHKGTFGTVIVVGGSSTMIGAPALAASAALRGGAGLVKIAAPAQILPFTLVIEPGATGIVLSDVPDVTVSALDEADPSGRAVLAIGPGMGRGESAGKVVTKLLSGRRAIVLDADGLNHLAATARPCPGSGRPLVLTPHPGEFRRLAQPLQIDGDPTDPADRPAVAARLAFAHGCVVVLKGKGSVVTDGRRGYVNSTGNPALSTAGTGDVLAGLVSALMAQGMEPFEAAVLGAYLHGRAADLWREAHGPSGLTARELADRLPSAMQERRKA